MKKIRLLGYWIILFSVSVLTTQAQEQAGDTTLINQFLGLFTEADSGNIPDVQRSKRKQVDQLLSAILKQPWYPVSHRFY